MKLPNAEHAIVDREKLTDYLLNPAHRYGASQAKFLVAFGFRLDDWQQVADARLRHGQTHAVTNVKQTPFSPRYEIDGELIAPDGRMAVQAGAEGSLIDGSGSHRLDDDLWKDGPALQALGDIYSHRK